MKSTTQAPRIIDPELLKKLDPTEQIIAKRFIQDGRWQLREATKAR